jgi:glycolate oxidase FAD binding subunit
VDPAGGLTLLAQNARVVVSSAAFNRIEEYEPEDLTITVGAGVRLTDLQRALETNRQWLPLDPPALPGATIGGIVASAAAGPLRAKYGTPRDHVLGLEMVTGDGRPLRFGGRVVKNVAGYDMVRPVVGSHGALGFITSVSLRLRPMPESIVTLLIPTNDSDSLLVARSIENALPIAALEVLSPVLAAVAAGSHWDPDKWAVAVRLDGYEDEVKEAIGRIKALAEVRKTEIVAGSLEVWKRLSESEARARPSVRLAALPSHLETVIQIANRCADLMLAESAIRNTAIHATAGIVRLWGDPPASGLRPPALSQAAQDLAALDGSVRVVGQEHVAETRVAPRAPASTAPPGRLRELNRGVKQLFDPAGILPDVPS